MTLWSQIKERRITRLVLAYLAAGWVALAVVDQLVQHVLPAVVYQVALTLYLVGVLAALTIGWYHGEKGVQKAPLREIVILIMISILGLGASARIVRGALQEATMQTALADRGLDLRSIGVLYFQDMTADGSAGVVADGITEGLISTLSQVPELDVASRNAARAAQDLSASSDSIARVLAVGTLVDGTVDQVGDELRITVRVLEGESGVPLFRDSYSWPVDQLASVGSELADEVGRALRERLGVEIHLRQSRDRAPNSAAWLQVARAERFIRDAAQAVGRGDREKMASAYGAADEELMAAQRSAPGWAQPLALRSQVAYEGWRLSASAEELLETLDRAVLLADSALLREPDHAGALEWRGSATYRRYLLERDEPQVLDALLTSARADLERSLRLDPTRASANSTLSHLYYQVDDWAQAVLAARQAYQQDAFLTAVDQVLLRLYLASYDLGQHAEARDWCLEGYRRFPENYRFTQCQIYVMTLPGASPDVRTAWDLYGRMLTLMPEGPASQAVQGVTTTFIGGVIGLAGLADSADVVWRKARLGPDLDPGREQMSMEAAMRAVVGDVPGAVERLEQFMVVQPGHFPGDHWWWRGLQGEPAFRRLQATR